MHLILLLIGHKNGLWPTPFDLNNDTIRLYCGFRDHHGISRIGYIDVQR